MTTRSPLIHTFFLLLPDCPSLLQRPALAKTLQETFTLPHASLSLRTKDASSSRRSVGQSEPDFRLKEKNRKWRRRKEKKGPENGALSIICWATASTSTALASPGFFFRIVNQVYKVPCFLQVTHDPHRAHTLTRHPHLHGPMNEGDEEGRGGNVQLSRGGQTWQPAHVAAPLLTKKGERSTLVPVETTPILSLRSLE